MVLAGQQQLAVAPRKPVTIPKPQWHPPWKLYRVSAAIWQTIVVAVVCVLPLLVSGREKKETKFAKRLGASIIRHKLCLGHPVFFLCKRVASALKIFRTFR